MNEENCNTRRKSKKWYAPVEEIYDEDDVTDLTGTTPTPTGQPIDDVPLRFKPGTPISIVDNNGTAMAHGVLLDDEPTVSGQDLCGEFAVGHFKLIQLRALVRGWGHTTLQRDEVFDFECQPFNAKHRKLQELMAVGEGNDGDEGIYIWHGYVKPRIRAEQKKRVRGRRKP
jgi:hypothetical protein